MTKATSSLAITVILGAMAIGCGKEQPLPASVAPVAAVAVAPAPPAKQMTMPGGWRDLRFGMSEADAKNVVLAYRKDPNMKWVMSPATTVTTVRMDIHKVDYIAVDRKRFHEWSIRELDDGASSVHAWFDDGKLVAIQVDGTATPDTFVRKASEAYGAAPRNAHFSFFDDRTMTGQIRTVSYWRGDDMTAFVWSSASVPTLLLWSNAALESHAARYQAVVDAPKVAASKVEQVNENGTKF